MTVINADTIGNYSALVSTIALMLDRDDLSAIQSELVTLADAQIRRDVRHWRQIKRATATLDSRYLPLPNDWQETIRLQIDATGTGALQLISMEDMADRRAVNANAVGKPSAYAHVGADIEVWPTPDASYSAELTYYQVIPTLGPLLPNWLLEEAPDAYLYGALIHSAAYLGHDERLPMWTGLYEKAVARLNASGERAKMSGMALRMRMPRR